MGALYDALAPKQRRVIKNRLNLIFSSKGITFPKSREEMRALQSAVGFIPPEFRIKGRQLFFSKESVTSIRDISSLVKGTDRLGDELTYNDIYQAVLKEIERWFNQELTPDESDFIESLDRVLCEQVATHGFFCRVDGISLDGVAEIQLGSKVIRAFVSEDVQSIIADQRIRDTILKEYDKSTIIKGFQIGSRAAAQEKFNRTCELCLSVLRLYACLLYEWAISVIHIRLINTSFGSYGRASCVGWTARDGDYSFTRYGKTSYDLVLNNAQLDHLKTHCFFTELCSLIDKRDGNELEQAIVRSVYWFGEAAKDQDNVGKWLKLWSCVESFFSFRQEDITESNARGVAALLAFGPYALEKSSNYKATKTKIKQFYALRSRAIHRGEYRHIDGATLHEFSSIVAWIVIVMMSISNKGYTKLAQVMTEANRLDAMCSKEKRMRCRVYRSIKIACMFLILPSERSVADLPTAVKEEFGTAAVWKEIDLYPGQNLIGLNTREAIKNIQSHGYHIQEVNLLFEEDKQARR